MPPHLPAAVSGERFEFSSPAGRLSAYFAGQGPPLLLIHSVNAAASAAEVRPLHEHYQRSRSVLALDLPGYGFSDRSDRPYTPRLMTDAVLATVEQIRSRCGEAPIDALALSLSCEFLARAAAEAPGRFRSLALVSPTGFSGQRSRRGPAGSTYAMPLFYKALRGPGWGGPIFRALTRPRVIRYFLERTWGAREIDEELWRYDVITTRQAGAEHAPLCFLAGGLFSADIHAVYESLALPVWMSHGVRGDFTDYRGRALVADRPNWQFAVFQTGALPHFERAGEFVAAYDAFLARPTSPVR
jgi:pimeloyl-ACP methyl ester carboxylesterase